MEAIADYTPARASARTERDRLVADIAELEKRLAEQRARFEHAADPSYQRSANQTARELAKARDRLEIFDARQKDLDARRDSDETEAARKRAGKAADKFERALRAVADAAVELKEAGAELADSLSVTDSGEWPSRHAVNTAVRARTLDVLGSVGEIKLEGYGTRPTRALTERFES